MNDDAFVIGVVWEHNSVAHYFRAAKFLDTGIDVLETVCTEGQVYPHEFRREDIRIVAVFDVNQTCSPCSQKVRQR